MVTGLAHYLKLLIRIGLQGALKLEREKRAPDGLHRFLDHLGDLEALRPATEEESAADLMTNIDGLANQLSDCCVACREPIDDECVMSADQRWHVKPPHLNCTACQRDLFSNLSDAVYNPKDKRAYCKNCAGQRSIPSEAGQFVRVSKLQQFVFLLRVALARLLAVLRAGGTVPPAPGMSTMLPNPARVLPLTEYFQATPMRRTTARWITFIDPIPARRTLMLLKRARKALRSSKPWVKCDACGRFAMNVPCQQRTRRLGRPELSMGPKGEAHGRALPVVMAPIHAAMVSRL